MDAHQRLAEHQSNMEDDYVTKEMLGKEAYLHHDFHIDCKQEEEYWRYKSRSLWLKSGDRNTTYFPKQVATRKHHNSINEIQIQGQPTLDFDKIK